MQIDDLVLALLKEIGEDPGRQGLEHTPERVRRSFQFLTQGYTQDPLEILNRAIFSEATDEMLIVRDIDFYSLCEHHLLPFFGKCHVGYLPKGEIIGLSKIPRIVDAFSRRLQIQARMTTQIAECLEKILQPKGVAVVIDARHLCMPMSGVETSDSYTTTSSMLGYFKQDPRTRAEFLELIKFSA